MTCRTYKQNPMKTSEEATFVLQTIRIYIEDDKGMENLYKLFSSLENKKNKIEINTIVNLRLILKTITCK